MPAKSRAQQAAAHAEADRRKKGAKKSKKRAFGTATLRELRHFFKRK